MQNIWKKNAKLMLILLLDIFIISGATYAATTMYQSNIVGYDNTTSGLNSTNVQGALDEVYSAATDYTDVITRLSALETKIYPVGSIYIGVSNINPSTIFGGTWVAFGTGKTIVGVDTSQTEFDIVEETGGEKTHTLTVDEMPSHNHNPDYAGSYLTYGGRGNEYSGGLGGGPYWGPSDWYSSSATSYTGGNQPHNNLQPYITVYMWKRTA